MKKQIINAFQKCEKTKMEENLRGTFLRRKMINSSITRTIFSWPDNSPSLSPVGMKIDAVLLTHFKCKTKGENK